MVKLELPNGFLNIDKYLKEIMAELRPLEQYCLDMHPFDICSPKGDDFIQKNFKKEWIDYIEKSDCLFDHLADAMLTDEISTKIPSSYSEILFKLRSLKLPLPLKQVGSNSDAEGTAAGMGTKKLHEVKLLSQYIESIAKEKDIQAIVDFGSGLGYLTHELSKSYPVIAVESEKSRSDSAQIRSQKLAKRQKEKPKSPIVQVSEFLTPQNSSEIFIDAAKRISGNPSKFLLTGLHACGDLSARTMSDLFVANPLITSLVSCGCCYHLMDTSKFPQSQRIANLGLSMSKPMLKMACHTFVSFDKARLIGLWKGQTVRAITRVTGKLPLDQEDSLATSLEKTFAKFSIEPFQLDDKQLHKHLCNLAMFSVIRASMGPLIEAAVLLDRALYLEEKGFNTELIALFNPAISPRNFVVVANKH